MDIDAFDYTLPEALIAQHPAPERTSSRLLRVGRDDCKDYRFRELGALLRPDDLLIFNDTRVIPARLYGRKSSGGRTEILIERLLPPARAYAQLRGARRLRVGQVLVLENGATVTLVARHGALFEIEFGGDQAVDAVLESVGHVPLPPYIHRDDEVADRGRYQTVYAREPGSVAAPTAGLHFDETLMDELRAGGVRTEFITLQVGLGTFEPVRVRDPRQHHLHSERVQISATVCDTIGATRAVGGRIIAVGTTTVRALESAGLSGSVAPFDGETRLFILPGHRFRAVDALITNFHLPRSTLLMMVCAMGGTDRVLAAYRYAVDRGYRFYSYGDAMFVSSDYTTRRT
jgi:S-adenosylmethionine:tRNA ribosyltransferase-isomerase